MEHIVYSSVFSPFSAAHVVADMAHNIANKSTETPSFPNG
jgi:hypothetical protein